MHPHHHHGQRPLRVPGQPPAPPVQVRPGLHAGGQDGHPGGRQPGARRAAGGSRPAALPQRQALRVARRLRAYAGAGSQRACGRRVRRHGGSQGQAESGAVRRASDQPGAGVSGLHLPAGPSQGQRQQGALLSSLLSILTLEAGLRHKAGLREGEGVEHHHQVLSLLSILTLEAGFNTEWGWGGGGGVAVRRRGKV